MKTIYSLELARFLAAAAVFFGHYVHFYMHYKIPIDEKTNYILSLNGIGGLAIPTFFMISGIVFTHTYANKIRNNEVTAYNFALKRFARLYPLHLLTLIVVALLLVLLNTVTKYEYFIYPYNDVKHFILNLMFMFHWGFEDGHSLNAPVWSVSHEIILYINKEHVLFL